MSQEGSLPEAAAAAAPWAKEGQEGPRTCDYYRAQENLPARFNHPGWFRGYRMKERNPLFRTTNMDYGGKPPTVHEMPGDMTSESKQPYDKTCFHTSPHDFTDHLIKFGMYRNTGINTSTEKSDVTGPDNFITCFDTFNFHPSYRMGGPSFLTITILGLLAATRMALSRCHALNPKFYYTPINSTLSFYAIIPVD